MARGEPRPAAGAALWHPRAGGARGATRGEDLGRDFGAGLHEAEVRYLMRREWAQCAADVLWRRSKLGLRVGPEGARALDDFMAAAAGRLAAE